MGGKVVGPTTHCWESVLENSTEVSCNFEAHLPCDLANVIVGDHQEMKTYLHVKTSMWIFTDLYS